jgi:anti-sigma regulatory factor (Ser/Thr protein kinase)
MSDTNEGNTPSLTLMPVLSHGFFRLRQMTEANLLAEYIASQCPNPRLVTVGISELIINAIEHGNLGITFDEKSELQSNNTWISEIERRLNLPENQTKFVEVEYTRTDTEIKITIIDQGKGFDWKKFEPSPEGQAPKSHGRGIFLAKNLSFKELYYSGSGNVVTCVIALTE